MNSGSLETIGVRYTGWAALARDPQEDLVEYRCPYCGHQDFKAARRDRAKYQFTDGFLQDVNGELATCRNCHTSLHVVPVVLVRNHDERRRFQAVFAVDVACDAN